MKYLISSAVFAITFLFIACQNNNCHGDKEDFIILENKSISIDSSNVFFQHYFVEEGDFLVFQYTHAIAQCDNILDDEWAEELSFEVKDSLDSFNYTDATLNQAKCFVRESGAWVNGQTNPIMKGSISGTKQNENTWDVSIAIIVDPLDVGGEAREITLNESFTIQ